MLAEHLPDGQPGEQREAREELTCDRGFHGCASQNRQEGRARSNLLRALATVAHGDVESPLVSREEAIRLLGNAISEELQGFAGKTGDDIRRERRAKFLSIA